jgi:Trk K+ transport system NAD-binding subunit
VELPEGFSLRRLPAPARWTGATLGELQLLGKERINVVQIVRPLVAGDEETEHREGSVRKIPLPDGATRLEEGDEMDVIGPDDLLDRLARE